MIEDFTPGTVRIAVWTGDHGDIREPHKALIHSGKLLAVLKSEDWRGWGITHVPTGRNVASGFKTRKAAAKVCRRIAKLDWNFRSPNSRKRNGLWAKVQEIRRNTW